MALFLILFHGRVLEANEEMVRNTKHSLADTAHVSGLTTKELTQRSAASHKSPARRSTSAKLGDTAKSREGLAKSRDFAATERSTTPSGRTAKGKKEAAPSLEETIPHAQVPHLKAFLTGATAAQRAQITMIRNVFETMDADKDGLLSMSDVRAYFRAVGRNASDLAVRKWIKDKDVDQDGAVSLSEFVASFALQLDPASRFVGPDGRLVDVVNQSTVLAEAFGALRLGGTVLETIVACDAADEYVRRILESPTVKPYWSISLQEEKFHKRIGRMFGGVKLMQALGFVLENNGTVLALRDPQGKVWESVPQDVRTNLTKRLEELSSHRAALLEPSISNIAAGILFPISLLSFSVYNLGLMHLYHSHFCFPVSAAIGRFGENPEKRVEWAGAVETILTIVTNILKYPGEAKYYNINTMNPIFHQK